MSQPNLHIVVSSIGEVVAIRPSRKVNRHQLIGLLTDAVYMLAQSEVKEIDPEECTLKVIVIFEENSELDNR